MKILFSNPPWWVIDERNAVRKGIRCGSRWPFTMDAPHMPDQFRFGGYLPFPFFLGHAAAHTKMLIPDADVHVRDSIARGEAYDSFYRDVFAQNYDFAVIETATPSLEHDLRIIEWLRGAGVKVILCGPLDASHHKPILDSHPNVHAIVQGEYDKQITQAIRGERGVLVHNLLSKEEMNAAPPPMWDEECATHYWDACPTGQQFPQLQMWTSRGCPFRCVFCVWPAAMTGNDPDGTAPRSVRCYSPEYVENHIISRLGRSAAFPNRAYKCVYFDDDTFNLREDHTLAMCDVMERIKLPWSAMCRADTIKKSTWQRMKDTGCFGVKIGFESGSQYVIDHIVNKRLDIAKAVDTCLWLQSIGIKVHTTWTTGLPGETKEQQQETLNLIQRMYDWGAHSTHQLSGTATVEGTPLDRIAHGERLAKYDGAIMSPDFKVTGDGQKKIEEMAR